jgi:hypothetical protein
MEVEQSVSSLRSPYILLQDYDSLALPLSKLQAQVRFVTGKWFSKYWLSGATFKA